MYVLHVDIFPLFYKFLRNAFFMVVVPIAVVGSSMVNASSTRPLNESRSAQDWKCTRAQIRDASSLPSIQKPKTPPPPPQNP
jgi:hypothetical protein